VWGQVARPFRACAWDSLLVAGLAIAGYNLLASGFIARVKIRRSGTY